MTLKIEDIDFDDAEKVHNSLSEIVEVPVGLLKVLLDRYYIGGGESDSLNDRLKEAKHLATKST